MVIGLLCKQAWLCLAAETDIRLRHGFGTQFGATATMLSSTQDSLLPPCIFVHEKDSSCWPFGDAALERHEEGPRR